MPRRRQGGFTLLELMLAVGIIGLLAAVALPAYQDYVIKSRVAEGFQLAVPVEQAVSAYRDRWGVLPRDNAAAGLPAPALLRGGQVSAISVHEGRIEIAFGPRVPASGAAPATMLLRPALPDGSSTGALVWLCHQGPAPAGLAASAAALQGAGSLLQAKFLPGSCREP